ncbi:MAG: DUF6492 family protein [Lachnospiraceae bacterium]|nr:DUF6492 family protein [Lachnospiraceae bacterium]
MDGKKFTMIVPTIKKDYIRITRDFDDFFKFLPIKEIIFIGPDEVSELIDKDRSEGKLDERIGFLREDELIPADKLIGAMRNRVEAAGYEMAENSRPGWYYQQFLKMAYSEVCKDDYYISWDIDTIPLRKVDMFDDEGKPYFGIKNEYQPGYFKTIKNLFGFGKAIKQSFIAEHMIFSVKYMKEMIAEIMTLSIKGDTFYEKIFFSIDMDNLKLGFSEFETFGTWICIRHPESYKLRDWHSMRKGGFFINSDELDEKAKEWLGGSFDAITFESYNSVMPELNEMFYNEEYRNGLTAEEFYRIALEGGLFGLFTEEGLIRTDTDVRWPY